MLSYQFVAVAVVVITILKQAVGVVDAALERLFNTEMVIASKYDCQ